MTFSKMYFIGSIIMGLHRASLFFGMLKHADSSTDNYYMSALALLWVAISFIALIGFGKDFLYILSPTSYVAYFLINFFSAPEIIFLYEFDATGINSVTFGVFYLLLNSWFLYREIHIPKKDTTPEHVS